MQADQVLVCVGLMLEARLASKHLALNVFCSEGRRFPELDRLSDTIEHGCVISFGLAGGLTSECRSADVIVASRIIGAAQSFATDDLWSACLLSALPDASYAPIAGADAPVIVPDARAALAARTGAVAVDMESHRVAERAAARSLPVVAVRVVIDAAHRRVPAAALALLSDDGRANRLKRGGALIGNPVDALDFCRLCSDWMATRRSFVACCGAIASVLQEHES